VWSRGTWVVGYRPHPLAHPCFLIGEGFFFFFFFSWENLRANMLNHWVIAPAKQISPHKLPLLFSCLGFLPCSPFPFSLHRLPPGPPPVPPPPTTTPQHAPTPNPRNPPPPLPPARHRQSRLSCWPQMGNRIVAPPSEPGCAGPGVLRGSVHVGQMCRSRGSR